MKSTINCLSVLVITFMFSYQAEGYKSVMASHSLTFTGSASGGVLILAQTPNTNSRYISITTKAGESAESVAKRLASAINESDLFGWRRLRVYTILDTSIRAAGSSLGAFPGSPKSGAYILGGTERGLGIPRPPVSLSCCYVPDKDQIVLRWVNRPEGYDGIAIVLNGDGGGPYPGTITKHVIDKATLRDPSGLNVCVIGYCGGVPSNAAAIHLSNNIQEELISLPFTDGIMPNWGAWSTSTQPGAAKFEQAVKSDVSEGRRNIIRKAKDKPFFQLIKAGAPDVRMGVSRKFLGLTPGHTYRISARLNTLEMNSEGDWSFSLHAAHNGPGGSDLTVQQLAGLAALADGSTGSKAGQIAAYGQGTTTNGEWVKRSTEITLPSGVDSITVWVRHSGSYSTGVGIDWVKLEDLSMWVADL